MYTIITVPTSTVAWTRAWLAHNTYNNTHVCRPHMLKLAIQDLWDASDLKKKLLVHQQGATCAEIGKCDDKPMSYVAHYISYVIKLRTKLLRSLRLL